MGSAFARFPPRLQDAIASRLGWTSLRPVQELASHAILDGNNAVVLAPTAGGKTEASIFPVLAQLIEREPDGVGLIYVAPIKALLNNQAERLGTYTDMVGLTRFLWHGDITNSEKRGFIKHPTTILMTTPESLEVMLLSPRIPVNRIFHDLRALIVDEVHALAGTDRGAHLISVFERLIRYTTHDVQRIGLSATVGNPHDILGWLQGTSRRSGCVVDPPKIPSPKDLKICQSESVGAIAQAASQLAQGKKSLFFCQSRSLAEGLAERMRNRGTDVFVHHSSVSLEERVAAEERFHKGSNTCIVCTSTLELGIDVGDLDLVLQANAPSTVSSFLQRLGRTGRRTGQRANTTFFCEESDAVLQAIAIIELAKKGWVESANLQTRVWPVLVHQLLALTLQFGAISAEKCWEQLSTVPDFSGISHHEFEVVIQHLIREGYLFTTGGLLSMGEKAERTFGRKNFMELYAVFSSPLLYTVKTLTGHIIGSLEQNFMDKLVAEMSSFLLGGRAWTVNHINHADRTVIVSPSPGGRKPTWGGFIPQLLSFEICQQIAHILKSEQPIPYIDATSRFSLEEFRAELNPILTQNKLAIQFEPGKALWWTFAGGQINHTLKYGLLAQHDYKVICDNFRIRIESANVSPASVFEAIQAMNAERFWKSPETERFILAQLPEYRLSKFQQALPEIYSKEMVMAFLLDLSGARSFINLYEAF